MEGHIACSGYGIWTEDWLPNIKYSDVDPKTESQLRNSRIGLSRTSDYRNSRWSYKRRNIKREKNIMLSKKKKKKDKACLKNSQIEFLGMKTQLVRGSQNPFDHPLLLSQLNSFQG